MAYLRNRGRPPPALAATWWWIASDRPLDSAGLRGALQERLPSWRVVEDTDLAGSVGDAPILTDDYVPSTSSSRCADGHGCSLLICHP